MPPGRRRTAPDSNGFSLGGDVVEAHPLADADFTGPARKAWNSGKEYAAPGSH